MEKIFDTSYGSVTVRNAMLELEDNTTLVDGIEISGESIELVEIYKWYDVDELTANEVEELINENY